MKKTFKIIIVTLILLIICFPTLLMGVFMEETETEYKQYIGDTPMPFSKIKTDKGLDIAIIDFRAYYLQHIAKRQSMIELWAKLNYSLNVSTSKTIVIGKNDMLFYSSCIRDSRGLKIYSDEQINTVLNKIKSANKYFTQSGAEFIFVIAPNKSTVYPENFPNWYTKSSKNATYMERIAEQYEKEGYDFNYLNLTSTLIGAKTEHGDILYPDTDAHWSPLGAYIGYAELMDSLSSTIKKVELNRYEINQRVSSSLLRHTGIRNDRVMDAYADIYFDGRNAVIEEYLTDNATWKYYFRLYNEEALNDKKILLIRDSFSSRLFHLLQATFTDVRAVHYHTALIGEDPEIDIKEIMDEYKPDIVIFQIVERALRTNLEDISTELFE